MSAGDPLFFAGIDGGQSSTTAVIGDRAGCVIGRGRAGPADEVGAGPESTRLHDALRDALAAARADAGLPDETHFAAIVAGVSGYDGRVYGRPPELPATALTLVHDAPIAHAGALAGEAGIVVIAGTGSVAYAGDATAGRTIGGWGYLFGDEGSAFWIARESLARLMRGVDESAPAGEELQAACDFFGLPTLRQVARAVYSGALGRERIAAFATVALGMAAFTDIADRGAERLAALVGIAAASGIRPTVACVGGMFADDRFRRRVAAAVRDAVAGVRIVAPRYEPSVGALTLAYRHAGIAALPTVEGRA